MQDFCELKGERVHICTDFVKIKKVKEVRIYRCIFCEQLWGVSESKKGGKIDVHRLKSVNVHEAEINREE